LRFDKQFTPILLEGMKSDTNFCKIKVVPWVIYYLLLVCKISAQYVDFYLVSIDSEKNNFSADVYVHLAVSGLMISCRGTWLFWRLAVGVPGYSGG
jgi:hypothetical protein